MALDKPVTSGEIFADNAVTTKVLEVIESATLQIALVSPYIDRVGHLEQALVKAKARRINILVVLRQDGQIIGGNNSKEALEWFAEKDITVKAVPNLHAKFYMNESQGVISSMNLLRSSWSGSLELGIAVTGDQHGRLVEYLRGHLMPLVSDAQIKAQVNRSETVKPMYDTIGRRSPAQVRERPNGGWLGQLIRGLRLGSSGYCIRCGGDLSPSEVDSDKVLCEKDYRSWARFKNPDFPEKYCTSCGREWQTTYSKPECSDCYYG
jgi:hypothetical protein